MGDRQWVRHATVVSALMIYSFFGVAALQFALLKGFFTNQWAFMAEIIDGDGSKLSQEKSRQENKQLLRH